MELSEFEDQLSTFTQHPEQSQQLVDNATVRICNCSRLPDLTGLRRFRWFIIRRLKEPDLANSLVYNNKHGRLTVELGPWTLKLEGVFMELSEFEDLLSTFTQYPEQSHQLINTAIDRAGSISRLADRTGVRRQSIALWSRGAVVPSQQNMWTIFNWLKKESAASG